MSVRIAQIDSRLAQIKIEFTHNEQILIGLAKERLALTNERILLISPPAPTQGKYVTLFEYLFSFSVFCFLIGCWSTLDDCIQI